MKKHLFFIAAMLILLTEVSAQYKRGDVNQDGQVNTADVVSVYNIIVNGDNEPDDSYKSPIDFTVNGVSFTMVPVEGGTFTMGATSEQGSEAGFDESPTHQVTLSNFYFGQTEVTQELWKAVTGYAPTSDGTQWATTFGLGDMYPAYNISYNDCISFIQKLSLLTGRSFRLPTEAEWEFAARGGNKSQGFKYSGSNNIEDVAWYSENSLHMTHEVAKKSPNELGLYDMTGNVYEWCLDWYGEYSSSDQNNPTGPISGLSRVTRGGSWLWPAMDCRVSCRGGGSPSSRDSNVGLRLAL